MIDSYYAGNGEFYTTREMYRLFHRNVRRMLRYQVACECDWNNESYFVRKVNAESDACLWQRRLFAHTGQWVEYQTADRQ